MPNNEILSEYESEIFILVSNLAEYIDISFLWKIQKFTINSQRQVIIKKEQNRTGTECTREKEQNRPGTKFAKKRTGTKLTT